MIKEFSAAPYRLFPAVIYMCKVDNESTITMCEIYSKLTMKIPERRK